jgi:ATP-dependent RNA helicase SUPV3L1/SUV3
MTGVHAPTSPSRIVAVLGPTNTGKTHLAIERMLAHGDGMIGLPLRLLAREVYDKVVAQKGPRAAALITGEERIAPESARYFICTVEAMPLERRTDFLAVDEIQLACDPDRGHLFTDRILRARGLSETMFLGSDTMRTMIRRLVPEAIVERRERFSTLSYVGARKLTKLTKRTAVVAFSAEEVYAIAELLRRQKGGAAVVMGALSPRTRNAQVALYQNGDVDFLVATDAIGMGLNMDVDHVAFASYAKFDGRRSRLLRPDEVAQIAGRAGRFRTDGSFGETGQCAPFDEETVERVETHQFETVEAVEWRSAALDFGSVRGLIQSLETPPDQPGLLRARGALDEETLKRLAREDDILDLVRRPADVRRLWEVCVTPDFRKATIDEHARLIQSLAEALLGPRQRLPQDMVAKALEKLDRVDGDLDSLQARLAHVRTWTYAANRPDWIDDCEHWRARARAVEDRLSDALHATLTARFIDRRTSALVRGLTRAEAIEAQVAPSGDVTVEGHHVGRLEGLAFKPDANAQGKEAQAVRNAAAQALRPEVTRRLTTVAQAPDAGLRLGTDGAVRATFGVVGRLTSGAGVVLARVALWGGEQGDAHAQRAAQARLDAWLSGHISHALAPLAGLSAALAAGALQGPARGLAFSLLEHGGLLPRAQAAAMQEALAPAGRAGLARLGVRFGRACIFMPGLLGAKTARVHSTLWHYGAGKEGRPFLADAKFKSGPAPEGVDPRAAAAAGLLTCGAVLARPDLLERFLALADQAARQHPDRSFVVSERLAMVIAADGAGAERVLEAVGYRRRVQVEGPALWRAPGAAGRAAKARQAGDPASPFAGLAALAKVARQPGPKRRRNKRDVSKVG